MNQLCAASIGTRYRRRRYAEPQPLLLLLVLPLLSPLLRPRLPLQFRFDSDNNVIVNALVC